MYPAANTLFCLLCTNLSTSSRTFSSRTSRLSNHCGLFFLDVNDYCIHYIFLIFIIFIKYGICFHSFFSSSKNMGVKFTSKLNNIAAFLKFHPFLHSSKFCFSITIRVLKKNQYNNLSFTELAFIRIGRVCTDGGQSNL